MATWQVEKLAPLEPVELRKCACAWEVLRVITYRAGGAESKLASGTMSLDRNYSSIE
jgi:hypothetical protein